MVLDEGAVTIGREGANALEDPTVSRRHVGISWADGHIVADLGSSHGCRLDGRPLARPTRLDNGAVLRLGDVFLVYEIGDPDDTSAVSKSAIPGQALSIRALRIQLARAATDPSPVLLLGETGTGKEWIARELHRLSGRKGPLIALNCAALSTQIVESQLFGHVKGAFTGATTDQVGMFRAADGGTLFLDELGELPLELQPKLLRALQDGSITPVGGTRATQTDVRVIAATNKDLQAAIAQGGFRLDLYSRLAMWELAIPPLRARRVDLLAWIARLGDAWSLTRSQPARRIALMPDAIETLLLHPWSDNLRGIDRLVHALRSDPTRLQITLGDLPPWLAAPTAEPAQDDDDEPRKARRPAPTREEFERAYAEHAGNVRALARHFDRDRRQIYRWLETYGLRGED
jgi:transcriptional regulator with PAS, ATPase and Fis domain